MQETLWARRSVYKRLRAGTDNAASWDYTLCLVPLPRASRLLVVIPAWNEQASVGHVVEEVRQVRPDAHILVVNDGSTDDTAGVARRAGAEVLTLPYNLGVGGAMRAGFRFAQWRDHDVSRPDRRGRSA